MRNADVRVGKDVRRVGGEEQPAFHGFDCIRWALEKSIALVAPATTAVDVTTGSEEGDLGGVEDGGEERMVLQHLNGVPGGPPGRQLLLRIGAGPRATQTREERALHVRLLNGRD